MYSLEEEILHFIFIAFKGLKRKKEDIDLVFHSIMVGNMLKSIGCSEKIVYTGYLHDIIEETSFTYEDLKEKYGEELANNVEKLSENQKIPDYKKRKEEFIKRLETYDNNLILVELADKLQNLISDYNLFLTNGKNSLPTEAKSYEEIKWFYTELKNLFNKKLEPNLLLERYNKIYRIYFND